MNLAANSLSEAVHRAVKSVLIKGRLAPQPRPEEKVRDPAVAPGDTRERERERERELC